jgi:hypothetical protein
VDLDDIDIDDIDDDNMFEEDNRDDFSYDVSTTNAKLIFLTS